MTKDVHIKKIRRHNIKKYLYTHAFLSASFSFIGQVVACNNNSDCDEGETCIITTDNTTGYCAYY